MTHVPASVAAPSGTGVGAWLRWAREQKGWSARSLSRKAGLSESYVTKLEAGQLDPSLEAFGRISIQLRLTPEEVFLCVIRSTQE